jgi:hypothetical protein
MKAKLKFVILFLPICILLAWSSQRLFEGDKCSEKAINNLPIYPDSNLMSHESDDDPVFGFTRNEYVTDAPFEEVIGFYDGKGTCFAPENSLAECFINPAPYVSYAIRIENRESPIHYQIIAEWNCKGLD